MKTRTNLFILVLLACSFAIAGQAQQTAIDTKTIDTILGVPGQMQGDVYRVGLPRTDLKLTVHGALLAEAPANAGP